MVVRKLRDTSLIPTWMVDFWSFESKGRLYTCALSRFNGSLYWAIVSATGTLKKPERVLMLSSGIAKTPAEEAIIMEGPQTILTEVKAGKLDPFDHVDQAKEHREKEFNTLLKGI